MNESISRGLKLRSLRLSENRLGSSSGGELSDEVFQNYTALEILDLSFNEISTISSKAFINQKHLRNLNLSRNFLVIIIFEFLHISNLYTLDLSNNSITQLNEETLEQFELLRERNDNFRMKLRGNPLECFLQQSFFYTLDAQSSGHDSRF